MSRRHSIISVSTKIYGFDEVQRKFSVQRITALNKFIADAMVLKMAEYILERSKTRHKSADRLGAPHTGTLEFSISNPAHTRRGGKIWSRVRGKAAEIIIQGVAGLARAFRALDIVPRRAKALTIPIDKESYAQTAAKMEAKGWKLFAPKRKRDGGNSVRGVLFGKKGGITKPLFALRHHVRVPRDPYLLPNNYTISRWAAKAMNEYMTRDTARRSA